MTLLEAIDVRRSRRKYIPTEIEGSITHKLHELINDYHKIGGFRMAIVLNNGVAFSKITKSYGMFSGVKNYIRLISDATDSDSDEKLGYYGELLVLHATALGLGTCWVGGAFDKKSMNFDLLADEKVKCAIIMGNVDSTLSLKEKLIYSATHRNMKSASDMYTSDVKVIPDWFESGMQAVAKAPSGMNKQPVTFKYKAGIVCASVLNKNNYLQAFDFGIAKLHFELGSGKEGIWGWGNGGVFRFK